MHKKVTKEVTKEQIPEEPSSESSEEEFNEKYLDLDELLYHLISVKTFTKNAEDWIRETRQLVEDKVEMKGYNPESSSLIEKYLADFTELSINLMIVVSKVSELTK